MRHIRLWIDATVVLHKSRMNDALICNFSLSKPCLVASSLWTLSRKRSMQTWIAGPSFPVVVSCTTSRVTETLGFSLDCHPLFVLMSCTDQPSWYICKQSYPQYHSFPTKYYLHHYAC